VFFGAALTANLSVSAVCAILRMFCSFCSERLENRLRFNNVIAKLSGTIFSDTVSVPDLSIWRPWAVSLLEAPTHPQMHNLHALTIVIITKYIYIFLWRPLSYGGPWATAQFAPPLT